jgi:hypothetical protein
LFGFSFLFFFGLGGVCLFCFVWVGGGFGWLGLVCLGLFGFVWVVVLAGLVWSSLVWLGLARFAWFGLVLGEKLTLW